MTQRFALILGLLAFTLVSGCRAFNSGYSNPEADRASKPRASESKKPPEDTKKPNESEGAPLPQVDYSKDTTKCETPQFVEVSSNGDPVIANSLWASNSDGRETKVTATQVGPHSAKISITKGNAECKDGACPLIAYTAQTLSFTVKQTANDKFSACDFKLTEGKDRVYEGVSGVLMVAAVNAVDEKAKTVTNSGTFHLTFTRAAEVTKAQAVLLGSAASGGLEGILLEGTYFADSVVSAEAK